jgi:hypothetical protein
MLIYFVVCSVVRADLQGALWWLAAVLALAAFLCAEKQIT